METEEPKASGRMPWEFMILIGAMLIGLLVLGAKLLGMF